MLTILPNPGNVTVCPFFFFLRLPKSLEFLVFRIFSFQIVD